MFRIDSRLKVFLHREAVDGRKSINRLALLVEQGLGLDPFAQGAYLVEFLDLPAGHAEADLHRGLLHRLKDFLIELGRDFCFVGSEFPLQVGNRDFALDLLFFHRGLN